VIGAPFPEECSAQAFDFLAELAFAAALRGTSARRFAQYNFILSLCALRSARVRARRFLPAGAAFAGLSTNRGLPSSSVRIWVISASMADLRTWRDSSASSSIRLFIYPFFIVGETASSAALTYYETKTTYDIL